MITYTLEHFYKYWPEVEPMFNNIHTTEVAAHQDKMIARINESIHRLFDTQNNLHSVIVRDTGTVIGYHISVIYDNLHFKTLDQSRHIRTAQVAHYFVHKDYRGKGIGSNMFRYAEKSLKELGVEFLVSEAKSYLPYASVFEHLNWYAQSIVFSKWIGE